MRGVRGVATSVPKTVACMMRPGWREEVRVFSRTFDRSFHMTWLRDHCKCAACVDPISQQKLRTSGSAAFAGEPISAPRIINQTLVVEFADHTAHVPVADLGVETRGAAKKREKGWLQPAEVERARGLTMRAKPTLSYDEFMNKEKGRSWAIRALHASGLVVVENTPIGASIPVTHIAERIAPVMKTIYGPEWHVRDTPGAENIAYTSREISWHQDLLYYESPPGIQVLQCVKQADRGGETLFLDGVEAADAFEKSNPDDFALLSKQQFTYQYANDSVSLSYRRPVFSASLDDHSHRRVFWSPPWQGRLRLHRGVKRMYAAIAAWEAHLARTSFFSLRLTPGTAVLFDNHRMLHARTAFFGEMRHLRGTYISRDAFREALLEKKVRQSNFAADTTLVAQQD